MIFSTLIDLKEELHTPVNAYVAATRPCPKREHLHILVKDVLEIGIPKESQNYSLMMLTRNLYPIHTVKRPTLLKAQACRIWI